MAERGVTQQELELEAGLGRGHVSKILSGQRSRLPIDTVEQLAKALGVAPGWLAYGDESATDPNYLRDEVVRLLGATKHPSAVAELRRLEAPGPDVSAEYWIRTLDALDAKYRLKKGKTG